MTSTSRLALATTSGPAEPSPAALAWLAGLTAKGVLTQYFCSRACPIGTEVVSQITGLPGRHLDSWLMPDSVLRSVFARGACHAELAIVEGTLDEPRGRWHPCGDQPGALRPIAETLDLPTVFSVPCGSSEASHFTRIPEGVDAIFLDGFEDAEDFERHRRFLTMTTGKPVVGGLERFPEARALLRGAPRDREVPEDLLGALGSSFLRHADLPAIMALADSRPASVAEVLPPPHGPSRFRVAYAMDEVFGAYFPDTLEALEMLGAKLVDFSPLRDERLPDRADLVMLGCGYPDRFARELASNVSLVTELRSHVRGGHRIYAEGGGTAYLGRSLTIKGRSHEGAGILPFDAELVEDPEPPTPVERTLRQSSWLGPAGTTVRGYLSGRWRLRPWADVSTSSRSEGAFGPEHDFFYHQHAVGGLVHLHLGALAEVMTAFADPHPPSLGSPSRRP